MPTLPTGGLTIHCRADVTTNLFKTFSSSGVHTGEPANGDQVEVVDETAGVSDQCFTWTGSASQSPLYRTATPLMAHSCLDFNGGRFLKWYNQTASAAKALSVAITNNAFTLIAAIYPQSIPTSAANVYNTDPILADYGQFWGLFLRDVAGVKKIAGYNWDGSEDVISMTITTGHSWIVIFQHTGGNLKLTLIDDTGTETSATDVPSGNTTNLTNNLGLATTGGPTANFRIGEFAIWNTALGGGTDLADAKQYFKDSWIPNAALNATVSDSITVVDSPSSRVITALNRTVNDVISVAESVATRLVTRIYASVAETCSVVEAVSTRTLTYLRALLFEAVSLTDPLTEETRDTFDQQGVFEAITVYDRVHAVVNPLMVRLLDRIMVRDVVRQPAVTKLTVNVRDLIHVTENPFFGAETEDGTSTGVGPEPPPMSTRGDYWEVGI